MLKRNTTGKRNNKLKPVCWLLDFEEIISCKDHRSSSSQRSIGENRKMIVAQGGEIFLLVSHSDGNRVSKNKITVCVCVCAFRKASWHVTLSTAPTHSSKCGKSIWIIHTLNDVTHTHTLSRTILFLFLNWK